jgi:molybdopterin-guanine dinucleotide biosynthesis protein A
VADPLTAPDNEVWGWLLAGGEGRRMGGVDKGLLRWHGATLAQAVTEVMLPQVQRFGISANRNLVDYAQLLQACLASTPKQSLGVHPDDPDLPPGSGPLAGILSGLRRSPGAWLQLAPCDTPRLPHHLVDTLLSAAIEANVDIAVPTTSHELTPGVPEVRHHWVCALVHPRVTPALATAFVTGERKVGRWIRSQRWVAVSFATASAFENMNSLETLDDRH